MLEKNSKKLIFDAHFHYFDCKKLGIAEFPDDFPDGWSGISCAHSRQEWELQSAAPECVLKAYGIHPQMAGSQGCANQQELYACADFLESLIKQNKIVAIGEAGFDYFTEAFKQFSLLQEEAWNIQLELAVKYELPLIIHCRKANHKLFEYSAKLSKLPEVLFHSFMGSPVEGLSLLKHGINGYFSFGKQVFNNNKKVIACVKDLPPEKVMAETDAPFQFLKGETFTRPSDIVKICEEIRRLKAGV